MYRNGWPICAVRNCIDRNCIELARLRQRDSVDANEPFQFKFVCDTISNRTNCVKRLISRRRSVPRERMSEFNCMYVYTLLTSYLRNTHIWYNNRTQCIRILNNELFSWWVHKRNSTANDTVFVGVSNQFSSDPNVDAKNHQLICDHNRNQIEIVGERAVFLHLNSDIVSEKPLIYSELVRSANPPSNKRRPALWISRLVIVARRTRCFNSNASDGWRSCS